MASSFFQSVYELTKKIPRGKVTTYGEIAKALGKPRNSLIVGYALHVNPDPRTIPCHRVVNRNGGLAAGFGMGGPDRQKELLVEEGIEISKGTIDLERYGFVLNHKKQIPKSK